MSTRSLGLTVLLAALLAGCGTVISRSRAPYVGAHPCAAIAMDALLVWSLFDGGGQDHDQEQKQSGELEFLAGLLSLPFDAVVDVVLLPVDLVGWLFGLRKDLSLCIGRAAGPRRAPGLAALA